MLHLLLDSSHTKESKVIFTKRKLFLQKENINSSNLNLLSGGLKPAFNMLSLSTLNHISLSFTEIVQLFTLITTPAINMSIMTNNISVNR